VEGEAFLTSLAVTSSIASSMENCAPNAIVFFYREVWMKALGWLVGAGCAKEPPRRAWKDSDS
jgi:hypothetical protein